MIISGSSTMAAPDKTLSQKKILIQRARCAFNNTLAQKAQFLKLTGQL
jgi:hypothetical protein